MRGFEYCAEGVSMSFSWNSRDWADKYFLDTEVEPYTMDDGSIGVLIAKLRPFYYGSIRVWRVMDPDLLSALFGVFHSKVLYNYIERGLTPETKDMHLVYNELKIYAIENVKQKTCRWYFQCGLQTEVNGQITSNTPLRFFIDSLRLEETDPRGIWCEGNKFVKFTVVLDFVLDMWSAGVMKLRDITRICDGPYNKGRFLCLRYPRTDEMPVDFGTGLPGNYEVLP